MNRLIYLIALVILFTSACAQESIFKQVNSQEFYQLTSSDNGILLDVRTVFEFKKGHIDDAGQLNYYAFDFTKKLLLLPQDQEIYLYCNTGYRSEKAAKILAGNGYKKVYNLQHGIMEWNLQNHPIVIESDTHYDDYLEGHIPEAIFGNCGTDAYLIENYRNPDFTMRAFNKVSANWAEAGVVPEKHCILLRYSLARKRSFSKCLAYGMA